MERSKMATYVVTNPQLYCSQAHGAYLSQSNPGMMLNGHIVCMECLENFVSTLHAKVLEVTEARAAMRHNTGVLP